MQKRFGSFGEEDKKQFMLIEGYERDYWGEIELDKDLGVKECLEDSIFKISHIPYVLRVLMGGKTPLLEVYWTERDTFYYEFIDDG